MSFSDPRQSMRLDLEEATPSPRDGSSASASAPATTSTWAPSDVAATSNAATSNDEASPGRSHRRRWLVIAIVVVVLAAGAGVAATQLGHQATTNANGSIDNTYPTSITTVKQQSLSEQTNVDGTLGYAGTYNVVNGEQGTITRVPAVGQVIGQGQAIYDVDSEPVILLYGTTPAYRALSDGLTGADVEQLNDDLVTLGDATSSELSRTSDAFSAATVKAVDKLEAAVGVTQNGTLTLGQVVFLPSALRVTTVGATLGGPAQPGMAFVQGTSTSRQVTIALDAAQQSQIAVGDHVTITLPDNSTIPGVVSSVGTVAATPSNNGGPGADSSPTVTVEVTPATTSQTGTFDQAPVSVSITTSTVTNALVVPVDALLALASGGYAIEVVDSGGVHHLESVTTGLFDDADGVVQIMGSGVAAGQQIVIPSS